MTVFLLILVLTSAIAGVFLTSPNFKIKVFDRYVVKGMTYGVMAFCLMIVFAILAGLQGVRL